MYRIRLNAAARAILTAAVAWLCAGNIGAAFAAEVHYRIVTNEISAKQTTGDVREVYRFDPAVYVAREGDQVTLEILGVKGHDHPVVLEGYNLRAMVHRNEAALMRFKADRPGFFRLICTAHADVQHDGPMEAYLIVVPK